MLDAQQIKNVHARLIKDLRSAIHHHPDREQDLLAFMSLYIKAEPQQRPDILAHLMCCAAGGAYPDPYESSYRYTDVDVDAVDFALGLFLEGGCAADTWNTILSIHERTGGHLLDTWRLDQLHVLLGEMPPLVISFPSATPLQDAPSMK
ncbi:hypothetical protein [Pseudoflavonifractor phocaeensis]|uniref:hypothetical protein n=1 Tax=Pseudoflavonifractor phocaeensis TaxID=1870988 RepID=UPI00210DAD9E|nr:hypothetical protein [Pseudoflavonifractor phocaeensis]MCQ4862696.1 hypothetical protein [Pseudoflavonifractor phocaeensis]